MPLLITAPPVNMPSYFRNVTVRRLHPTQSRGFSTSRPGRRVTAAARLAIGAVALIGALSARGATVSGIVTDAGTGSNLPSMIVRAYTSAGADPGLLTTTDSTGRYTLGVPPGDYRILAYDQNGIYATTFAGDADSFETSAELSVGDKNVANYNFALRRGGVVTGRALAGSSPIGDGVVAAYNLSGTRRGFTVPDNSGNYSIVLPPGPFKLVAFDNNKLYAPQFFFLMSSFNAATPVQVSEGKVVPNTNFALARGGRLAGFVMDSESGAPVAGMLIAVYDDSGALIASQQSTSDQFDITVSAGTYRLVASDPAHSYAPAFFGGASNFDGVTPISIRASELRSELRFDVVPAAHVRGRTLSESGAPLKDITIAAYNRDGSLRTSVRTSSNGEFQLDLPAGTFKLVASDEALVYAVEFFSNAPDFRSAEEITVSARQDFTADFAMAVGGNFSGEVTDAQTHTPLGSITVGAYNATGDLISSAKTNEAGQYKLVVPAGSFRLAASDPSLRYAASYDGGFIAFEPSPEVRVESGSSVDVPFQLTTGVLLLGSVRDFAQRPINGVDVGILDAAGDRVATARSRNGGFEVTLLPGTYKFLAVDPQRRYTPSFYDRAQTFRAAAALTIRKDGPTPSVTFLLLPTLRHRATAY